MTRLPHPKDEIIWQQQKENKELKKDIEGMRRANEQLQKENEDLKKENEVIKRVSEQLQQEIDDLKKAQIGGKGKAEVWIWPYSYTSFFHCIL